jgi:hypothetical protein
MNISNLKGTISSITLKAILLQLGHIIPQIPEASSMFHGVTLGLELPYPEVVPLQQEGKQLKLCHRSSMRQKETMCPYY